MQHAGNVTSGRHRQPRFNLVGQRELKLGLLRVALERLNPALPPEATTAAVGELTRDPSSLSLEAANRQVYRGFYLTGRTGWGGTFAGRPAVLWKPNEQSTNAITGAQTNQPEYGQAKRVSAPNQQPHR